MKYLPSSKQFLAAHFSNPVLVHILVGVSFDTIVALIRKL